MNWCALDALAAAHISSSAAKQSNSFFAISYVRTNDIIEDLGS